MISFKKYVGSAASLYRSGFSRLANMNMVESTILTCAWSPIVWKDNYALGANFEFSDFLVLDFDKPGDETMADVNRSLQDHKRIIAPTKSHTPEDERYRLIIPWERRISDFKTYAYNMRLALKRFDWADKNCVDGARFYFPSKRVFAFDRTSEYLWEVKDPPPAQENIYTEIKQQRIIPTWALAFINRGLIYNDSRNMTIFNVAIELAKRGFSPIEVENLIKKAPIAWYGTNVRASIQSAFKKKDAPN